MSSRIHKVKLGHCKWLEVPREAGAVINMALAMDGIVLACENGVYWARGETITKVEPWEVEMPVTAP